LRYVAEQTIVFADISHSNYCSREQKETDFLVFPSEVQAVYAAGLMADTHDVHTPARRLNTRERNIPFSQKIVSRIGKIIM
jgi:hypothetical protein